MYKNLKMGINNAKLQILVQFTYQYKENIFFIRYDGQNGEFLTHGDMWSNNVMFHGSKVGIIIF